MSLKSFSFMSFYSSLVVRKIWGIFLFFYVASCLVFALLFFYFLMSTDLSETTRYSVFPLRKYCENISRKRIPANSLTDWRWKNALRAKGPYLYMGNIRPLLFVQAWFNISLTTNWTNMHPSFSPSQSTLSIKPVLQTNISLCF